jgi:hypothetical protein
MVGDEVYFLLETIATLDLYHTLLGQQYG